MFALLTVPRGPATADEARSEAESEADAFGIVIRPAPAAPGRVIAAPRARTPLRLAMA
ncbi:MAG TPA: hypothetical protein VFQ39_02700 [Longimicrobium sp.]|nr:hypothetical protein [Longimicrobium sp.]